MIVLIIAIIIALFLLILFYICRIDDNIQNNLRESSFAVVSPIKNVIERSNITILRPKVKHYDSTTYPEYNNLLNIVTYWNPDIPEVNLGKFQETLQHFNYSNIEERRMAEVYRNNEVPFKLYDIPEINKVMKKWNDEYLINNMRSITPHVEESTNNHFMFWNTKAGERHIADYKPPTKVIKLKFKDWLQLAYNADMNKVNETVVHYYYMIGVNSDSNFVGKDLDIFSTKFDNYFITNVKRNKGIQCRFGMRGIIAEAHYDSGRNMVAMVKGHKRYILTPPNTCSKLGIISDVNHPSYRHSVIDWSDINQAKSYNFDKVQAIDTIVREGEILYIPSYWFHYIISLEYSIQCNSRSGTPPNKQGEEDINKCLGNNKKKK